MNRLVTEKEVRLCAHRVGSQQSCFSEAVLEMSVYMENDSLTMLKESHCL